MNKGPVISVHPPVKRNGNAFLLLLFFFVILLPRPVQAAEAEEPGRLGKMFRVFSRGVVNIVTLPLEIPRSVAEQRREHPRVWLWRSVPVTVGHVLERSASAVHDVAIYPWYVNRRSGDSPLTRSFDLPDYPWQKKEKKAEAPEHAGPMITSARG